MLLETHSESATSSESPPSSAPTPNSTVSDSNSEDSEFDSDLKPKLPYKAGLTLFAKRHIPPEPFGHGYDSKWPSVQPGWEDLSQTEYCLSRPPLEGVTDEQEESILNITSVIRADYDIGAQLLVVNNSMVAKIYDPLYYQGEDDYGAKVDVVVTADGDYSREAAAYTELESSPQAKKCIPTYFGSWTVEVDTHRGIEPNRTTRKRQVRLILLELVKGECMDHIEPEYIHKAERSNIVVKALEAEAIIYTAGVVHRDISPRNIMVIGSKYYSRNLQVKIIDFNVSSVHRLDKKRTFYYPRMQRLLSKWPEKIMSPIPRYWNHMAEFSENGWVSNEEGRAQAWLWKHFHRKKEYIPVECGTNNPGERPRERGWDELCEEQSQVQEEVPDVIVTDKEDCLEVHTTSEEDMKDSWVLVSQASE